MCQREKGNESGEDEDCVEEGGAKWMWFIMQIYEERERERRWRRRDSCMEGGCGLCFFFFF